MKPVPSAHVIKALEEHEGMCAIPAIVFHEIRYGILRMADGRKKDRLMDYFSNVIQPFLPVIPYDEHAAYFHADFRAERPPLPFADGQIASIAIANNLILVTRNTSDFLGIRHLMVENWFETTED
jgi:tRNA(fMet)-specific endonuclease VapC